MKFEVEQLLTIQNPEQTYVLARQITPSEWMLTDNARLGGVPIHRWLDIPRTGDEKGDHRTDLFAFLLRDTATRANFSVGQIVDLQP